MSVSLDDDQSMRCPKCGKRYPGGFAFCPDDAADLVAALPEADGAGPAAGMPKSVRIMAAGGAALLALAIIAGVIMARQHPPAPVAVSAPATGSETEEPLEGDGGPGPSSAPPADMTWDRYSSDLLAFQVDHPTGWQMTGPASKGGTTVVSFASPDGRERILVDVDGEAPPSVTPRRRFEAIDRYLRKKNGDRYQLLSAEDIAVNGKPAISWLFTVRQDDGSVLETRDIAVPHAGNKRSYGVLCTAPQADFESWRGVFDKVVAGLSFEG